MIKRSLVCSGPAIPAIPTIPTVRLVLFSSLAARGESNIGPAVECSRFRAFPRHAMDQIKGPGICALRAYGNRNGKCQGEECAPGRRRTAQTKRILCSGQAKHNGREMHGKEKQESNRKSGKPDCRTDSQMPSSQRRPRSSKPMSYPAVIREQCGSKIIELTHIPCLGSWRSMKQSFQVKARELG